MDFKSGISIALFATTGISAFWFAPHRKKPSPISEVARLSSQSLPVASMLNLFKLRLSSEKPPSSGAAMPVAKHDGKTGSTRPSPKKRDGLSENWDLEGSGLTAEELAPFLNGSQPESIIFYDGIGSKRLYPKHYENGEAQSDKILFIGNEDSITKIAEERRERAADEVLDESSSGGESQSQPDQKKFSQLSTNAYQVASFEPGKGSSGEIIKPIATDLHSALQGPDYSFDFFDASDEAKMRKHLSTILPVGNAGMLVLEVKEGGVILDRPGFDFSVFQTTFRIAGTQKFWQKFASLGVSEDLDARNVKWFPCEPQSGVLRGCVGVVPTEAGGDQFDLGEIGVSQARYIWIKDTGSNFNFSSSWPTEGCAIDALRFNHAFKTK